MNEKKWHKITFYAKLDSEDLRAMNKCFFDAMSEAMGIDECDNLTIEEDTENV